MSVVVSQIVVEIVVGMGVLIHDASVQDDVSALQQSVASKALKGYSDEDIEWTRLYDCR